MCFKGNACKSAMSVIREKNYDEITSETDDADVVEIDSVHGHSVTERNSAVGTEKRVRKMTDKGVSWSIENL